MRQDPTRLADIAAAVDTRLREIKNILFEYDQRASRLRQRLGQAPPRNGLSGGRQQRIGSVLLNIEGQISKLKEEECECKNLLLEIMAELSVLKLSDFEQKMDLDFDALYPDNWHDISQDIKRRDNWRCQECGTEEGILHVHHEEPISQGGSNEDDNLVTLCESCHASRHPHMNV